MKASNILGFQALRHLTHREIEVVELLLDARCDKEIAQSLRITVRTVRFHLGNIFRKFGVATRGRVALFRPREERGPRGMEAGFGQSHLVHR
jgi:DNA-binding CsgD family transcriptional regulator